MKYEVKIKREQLIIWLIIYGLLIAAFLYSAIKNVMIILDPEADYVYLSYMSLLACMIGVLTAVFTLYKSTRMNVKVYSNKIQFYNGFKTIEYTKDQLNVSREIKANSKSKTQYVAPITILKDSNGKKLAKFSEGFDNIDLLYEELFK